MREEYSDCLAVPSQFAHRVNGKVYLSGDCSIVPANMEEYKRMVREAYGDLYGVMFYERGKDFDTSWLTPYGTRLTNGGKYI